MRFRKRPAWRETGRTARYGSLAFLLGLLLALPAPFFLPPTSASSAKPHPTKLPDVRESFTAPPHAPFTLSCPVGYSKVGMGWPISPQPLYQYGACPPVGQDQVHLSLISNATGSGDHFQIPLLLPGPTGPGGRTESLAYTQFSVGIIVGGDPRSEWGQSFAEVSFAPQGAGSTYDANVSLWSLVNSTIYLGGGCPGLNFTWNSSYYCELQDLGSGGGISLGNGLPAGEWANVSFVGNPSGSAGLLLWVNSSTAHDSYRFNATNTGTFTFEPFFDSSCSTCVLHWGTDFGNGLLFDLCPNALPTASGECNSYNASRWLGLPLPTFGSPEFFRNGTYQGDFLALDTESTSGACTQQVPNDSVAQCLGVSGPNGGDYYYPFFAFNGSQVEFGINNPWDVSDWGGPLAQYSSLAISAELSPLLLESVTNNSRGGYVLPGASILVNSTWALWGTKLNATLHYQTPAGGWMAIPMIGPKSGGPSGLYQASIPSGSNGTLHYWVSATDQAGGTVSSSNYTVVRGPLPHFYLQVTTSPVGCGQVVLNGTIYNASGAIGLYPGTYPLRATGCPSYAFNRWNATAGISVGPNLTADNGTVTVSASGTLDAMWSFVRPRVNVTLISRPGTCGPIYLNGSYFSNGTNVTLGWNLTVPVRPPTCGMEAFSGWNVSGPLLLEEDTLIPLGNGTLTAVFLNRSGTYSVTLQSNPATCGGIQYAGAAYGNGTVLTALPGTYPVAPSPCSTYALQNFSTEGNVSLSGHMLTVHGSGTLVENNYPLTEITFLTYPSFCGAIIWDGVSYRNGSRIVVQNDSIHSVSVSPCFGTYLLALTGTGGVNLTGTLVHVNASGELFASFANGAPSAFVGFVTEPSSCGYIVFGGVRYDNSNYTQVPIGSVWNVSEGSCANYGFVGWSTTGHITWSGGIAYINGSGTLVATYSLIVAVTLLTQPGGCGNIVLGGVSYPDGATAFVPEHLPMSLAAVPCPFFDFTGWVNSSGANLLSSTRVEFSSGAQVTAQFTRVMYILSLRAGIGECGSLQVAGVTHPVPSQLPFTEGNYSFFAIPCPGWYGSNVNVTGNVTLNRSTLWVYGNGTLVAHFALLSLQVNLVANPSGFVGGTFLFLAQLGSLPSHDLISYQWNYGDGTPVSLTVKDLGTHVYLHTGTFQVTVKVMDTLNRTATASVVISVYATASTSRSAWISLGQLVTVLGAAAVLLAGVSLWKRRRDRPVVSRNAGTNLSDTQRKMNSTRNRSRTK